jgi:GTPase SAR1 family protein
MKILTLGNENSGKTVFLTMLVRYMSSKQRKLPIHVENVQAAVKINDNLKVLKSGDWPFRHFEGSPHEIFTFRLGSLEGKRIQLWDFPGESFRKLVTKPDGDDHGGHIKNLRETSEEAHLLIYLLDLEHMVMGDACPRAVEDALLFREFLTNPRWKKRQRLVVITKADLFRGLIEEAKDDLRKVIKDVWPDDVVACPLTPGAFPNIDFFPVTSVKSKSEVGKDRKVQRRPRTPLQSEGFDHLVERILSGLDKAWWTRVQNGMLSGGRTIERTIEWTIARAIKWTARAK